MTKTQTIRTAANAAVTNRGPRMPELTCWSTWVTNHVCSGG
jgi:hypothetical protein